MTIQWRIQLFGDLRATSDGGATIERFHTRKGGLLLACLAYRLPSPVSRAELIEILWPENSPPLARNSLSQALSWLRDSLEPAGVPADSVLQARRDAIGLNPEAVTTDVGDFVAALRRAGASRHREGRVRALVAATDGYAGQLLTGYYDFWVLTEQQLLDERYFQALGELTSLLAPESEPGYARDGRSQADPYRAIDCLRRGIRIDPLREEAQRDLIRLLLATGQPTAAMRQYRDLERILRRELATAPEPETRALIRSMGPIPHNRSARGSRAIGLGTL